MKLLKGVSPHTAVAFLLGAFIATAGTATAAKVITGRDIRNGSISEKDLSVALRQKLSVQVIEGPRGDAGATGETGAGGPTGSAGAKGDAGAAGAAGPTGLTGETGGAGAAGLAGATGLTGPVGPAGPAGPPGDPGAPGATGDPGAPGTASVTARFGVEQPTTAGGTQSADANCLPNEVAVGGAGYITGSNPGSAITTSVPRSIDGPMGPTLTVQSEGTPTGWHVEAIGLGTDQTLVAEVLCAPASP
jgi:hypothetical protein